MVSRLNEPAVQPGHQLGYEGFVVYAQGPAAVRPWLRVSNGTVQVLAGPGAGIYRDATGVEDWLLAEAERAGFGAVLAAALPQGKKEIGDEST
jgi:hypothetical protein